MTCGHHTIFMLYAMLSYHFIDEDLSLYSADRLRDCNFVALQQGGQNSQHRSQELSCRRQKASRLCNVIRYRPMQQCYRTVRFIIYNTDSKSSGCYSTVESTFTSFVTTKTQPAYESITAVFGNKKFSLPRHHAMHNVNPNLNPKLSCEIS